MKFPTEEPHGTSVNEKKKMKKQIKEVQQGTSAQQLEKQQV